MFKVDVKWRRMCIICRGVVVSKLNYEGLKKTEETKHWLLEEMVQLGWKVMILKLVPIQ